MVVAVTVALWLALLGGGLLLLQLTRERSDDSDLWGDPGRWGTGWAVPSFSAPSSMAGADDPAVCAARPAVRGTCQILFTSASPGGSLRVDCVLIGDDMEGATPGSLMTVRLYPPLVPAAASPFETVLTRWADDLQVLSLDLIPSDDGWHLHLDDGASRLDLEITEAAGVS